MILLIEFIRDHFEALFRASHVLGVLVLAVAIGKVGGGLLR